MTDHEAESAECGYIVTPGFVYCRACGGGGLSGQDVCTDCLGQGELPDSEAS